MEATLNSTFTNLIAAFLGKTKYKQREEPNLYVFQGFTQEFYVNLQQQIPHLTFDLSVTYPSVNQFISESKELLLNMLQLSTAHWIYYEEFCVIYLISTCTVSTKWNQYHRFIQNCSFPN